MGKLGLISTWSRFHSALACLLLLLVLRHDVKQLRPLVLEPDGLQERLQAAMAQRQVSEAELDAYQRDGVVVFRGLLEDRKLLRELARGLAPHQQFSEAVYTSPWEYNGVARAVLRHGLLADLGTELLGVGTAISFEAPIWGIEPGEFHHGSAWHQDSLARFADLPAVTLWFAVTEAPHCLEFLRGSHRVREEFSRECNLSREQGEAGHRVFAPECVVHYADKLSAPVSQPPFYRPDLQPGDAVAFDGNLAHRGVRWTARRTAIALRLQTPQREFPPGSCTRLPVIYRHRDRKEDPFRCIPELVLPRPMELWRWLPDRLPRELLPSGAERMLRSAAVAFSQAVCWAARWLP